MTTGLRRGEVCILRWSRVDLDAGEIEIRSSYRLRNGVGTEKDTKTHQCAASPSIQRQWGYSRS
jgi:integrase